MFELTKWNLNVALGSMQPCLENASQMPGIDWETSLLLGKHTQQFAVAVFVRVTDTALRVL